MILINNHWCKTFKNAIDILPDKDRADALLQLHKQELNEQELKIKQEWQAFIDQYTNHNRGGCSCAI